LIEIERQYKLALPLPNPDIHELIAKQLEIEPSKVFFGINLVRAKMKLPKLEYPKRKLAVTPDQLQAVDLMYAPFLPTPPIGIHKIIAKQLKMDEWRVHVAIGLLRKQKEMPRWNEDRSDLPESMKQQLAEKKEREAEEARLKAEEEAAKPPKPPKAEKEKKPKKEAVAAEAEVEGDAEVEAPEPKPAEPKAAKGKAKAKAAVAEAESDSEDSDD
jgi:hypothetical protein